MRNGLILLPLFVLAGPVAADSDTCSEPVRIEQLEPTLDADSDAARHILAAREAMDMVFENPENWVLHTTSLRLRARFIDGIEAAEAQYGAEDPRVSVPLIAHANFLVRFGRQTEAQRAYRRASELLLAIDGPGRLAAAVPLSSLARFERPWMVENRERLAAQTVELFDGHPCPHPMEFAEALLLAGDIATMGREADEAAPYYRRAWVVLESSIGAEATAGMFDEPARLRVYLPPVDIDYHPWTPAETARRYMNMELAIGADGTVDDVAVVDHDLPARPRLACVRSMRRSLFRPRLDNGLPVATTGVRYKVTFEGITPRNNDGRRRAFWPQPIIEAGAVERPSGQ